MKALFILKDLMNGKIESFADNMTGQEAKDFINEAIKELEERKIDEENKMSDKVLLERITELENEVSDLKLQLGVLKPFKFKYGDDTTFLVAPDEIEGGYSGNNPTYYNNFRYRQTKVNAQVDFQLQKELMCIGALAEQIDQDYKSKVIWNDANNWTVAWDNENNEYILTSNSVVRYLGVVYMPQDVAEKVCDILNNKEVII